MSVAKVNPYDYSTAADYARLSGHDRTTIVRWIRQGKISAVNKTVKSRKKNFNKHWKIANKSMQRPIKKMEPLHGKTWTSTELYILESNIDAPIWTLEKLLRRSGNAIRIKRCRLRAKQKAERGSIFMSKTVNAKLDAEDTLNRLDSWLAKVEPCYYEEVRRSMESFKREYGLVENDDYDEKGE